MNGHMMFATHPQAGGRPPQGCAANILQQMTEILFLVLDVSGSMEADDWPPSRLWAAQEAALALLEVKSLGYPGDQVAIITFSETAAVINPPTEVRTNLPALKYGLGTLKTRSSTDMGAGLQVVEALLRGESVASMKVATGFVRFLKFAFAHDEPPRSPMQLPQDIMHRVVLLTDGDHNGKVRPEPVADRLKQGGVVIDCLGIGGSPTEVNEDLLRNIASTGPDGQPRYCFIGDKTRLITKFEQLGHHIRSL